MPPLAWGQPATSISYPPEHVAEARRVLDDLSDYFVNYRVMSEAMGSSYEYLAQCWKWRVPGPPVVAKAKRLLELCQELEQTYDGPRLARVQLGWWLACVHFSLADPESGVPIGPGRLYLEHPVCRPEILAAARDDLRQGSRQQRQDLAAARVKLPAHAPKDARRAAKTLPWFVLRPVSRHSLYAHHLLNGKTTPPSETPARGRESGLRSLLEEQLAPASS